MKQHKQSIGVIGAGAWGTALANLYSADGRDVMIWARENEVVDSINQTHINTLFLPDITLHDSLTATGDIAEVAGRDIVLIVTPAQFVRTTLVEIKQYFGQKKPIILCAKGIEIKSRKLLTEVVEEIVPGQTLGILSGPTFAHDIAQGLPGGATIAADDLALAETLQQELSTRTFRLYSSDDTIGVELAGALKNVLAIGCGIVHGMGLGETARAGFLTRGVNEIARMSLALGGQAKTLLGMCGVGDITLTCNSMQSRNFSLGAALGEGKTLEEIMASRNSVAEGVHTAGAALDLAQKHDIEVPIVQAVQDIISGTKSVQETVNDLLDRPLTSDTPS